MRHKMLQRLRCAQPLLYMGGAAAPPACAQSNLLYNTFIVITREAKYKKQKENVFPSAFRCKELYLGQLTYIDPLDSV